MITREVRKHLVSLKGHVEMIAEFLSMVHRAVGRRTLHSVVDLDRRLGAEDSVRLLVARMAGRWIVVVGECWGAELNAGLKAGRNHSNSAVRVRAEDSQVHVAPERALHHHAVTLGTAKADAAREDRDSSVVR